MKNLKKSRVFTSGMMEGIKALKWGIIQMYFSDKNSQMGLKLFYLSLTISLVLVMKDL